MTISKRTSTFLTVTILLGSLLVMTCDEPVLVTRGGFVAAIVDDDGIVRTRFSPDGKEWKSEHIHTEVGVVERGASIASDPTGAVLYLACFVKDRANRTKLLVQTGIGANWETQFPNQIVASTESAPSIARLDATRYLIVWNGGDRVSAALFDSSTAAGGTSIVGLADLNDSLAQTIEGAPTVAVANGRILVIWRRRTSNNGFEYAANSATFNATTRSVAFGDSFTVNVPGVEIPPSGFPQLTGSAGFRLSLAVSGGYGYFASPDGRTWTTFVCPSSSNVLAANVRPHAFAVDSGGNLVHVIAPLVPGSVVDNERGLIFQNCRTESSWRDRSAFLNEGSASFQPAIAFRRGNQQP